MADMKFDLSDVSDFFREGMKELKEIEERVAKESVQYAVDNGSYEDRSGTLRKSNKYSVTDRGITLYNDATSPDGTQYASFVEAKGYEVLSGAALYAEKRLREEL